MEYCDFYAVSKIIADNMYEKSSSQVYFIESLFETVLHQNTLIKKRKYTHGQMKRLSVLPPFP